jgi:hypothetical protein
LALFKIQVLHPQAETFQQAQAAAIKQDSDHFEWVGETVNHLPNFAAVKDGGQALRFFGSQGVDRAGKLLVKDVVIQKEEGAKGLILGGGGHVLQGQVVEKGFNFRGIHIAGVAHVVEADKADDPMEVSFFGAKGIMLAAQDQTDLVEQFGGVGGA